MDSSVFSFNIKLPTLINESFVSDNMELSNDHLLMIEIASGNQEAMEKLIDRWKNAAFRFLIGPLITNLMRKNLPNNYS